jgi:hypothetical protein
VNHPAAYKIKVAPADHVDWSGDQRDRVYRGVVEDVGPGILVEDDEGSMERYRASLVIGNMIYYTGGVKIGQSVFIETTDIYAYEEAL